MIFRFKTLAFVALIIFPAFTTACCKKSPGLRLDTNFSSNLVYLSKEWPGGMDLTVAQSRLLEEKGEPSFERILWDSSGTIMSYMDVAISLRNKSWREKDRTWIYLVTNTEYEFTSRTNYVDKPLSDLMKTLCKYGDPQGKSILQQGKGEPPIVVWSYYRNGKHFHFLNEQQCKVINFGHGCIGFMPY